MAFDRVRVRLAPSPTGDPHVGTAYVTLFNYVFAKKHGGDLVLRIEDTDQTRYRASSEQKIMDCLRWLGLEWDEGPDKGGAYGPYRQSERRELHQKSALELVAKGHAYRCFCTAERLDQMRKDQRAAGANTMGYDRHCRRLSDAGVAALVAAKTPYVIRLAMPVDGITVVDDVLRGKVEFDNARIDDQILLKSDGFPTYHLANVVDDHHMKISHVIRAEEWVSSTPKHVQLYKAFGWDMPQFIHMPLLRNPDKSKISKRKNPTSLAYYQRAGILPETMVNFLGLMGWSYSDTQEVFTLAQMMEKFELKQIHLGGPIFDQKKLGWLNNQYLQKLDDARFAAHLRQHVFSDEYLRALRPLATERMDRFDQFVDVFGFFFNGGLKYEGVPLVPEGKTPQEVGTMLGELVESLDEVYDWDVANLKKALDDHKAKIGWKPKDYFMTVRLVVTGRKDSPPLVESMAVLGREMTRFRIRDAAEKVQG